MKLGRFYSALFFLLLMQVVGYGQDSTKIYSDFQYSKSLQDPSQSIHQMQSVLADAEKLHLDELVISIKRELAELYLNNEMNDEGLRLYFQLSNEFIKTKDYQKLFEVYVALSGYYEKKEFPNNSAEYNLLALELVDTADIGTSAPISAVSTTC